MLRRILAWHSRFHKSGHQAKRNGVLHETLREADRLAEEVFVATYAVVLRASVKDVSQMSGRSRQCCSSVRTYTMAARRKPGCSRGRRFAAWWGRPARSSIL